jgi:nitroreductase / dihydropteridine reductase
MNISNIAKTRYTTKAFDSTRKISADQLFQLRDLLRYAPSSVNSQPWHYVVSGSEEGKARIAKSTSAAYAFNMPKIQNASHVVVFCARQDMDEAHFDSLLAQEQKDGRFATDQARQGQDNGRRFFVDLNRQSPTGVSAWIEKQVYLSLGTLLLGAGVMGIDACPMEGFDSAILDSELNLTARGLRSVAIVALGYRHPDDSNAKSPKSRLGPHAIFTDI